MLLLELPGHARPIGIPRARNGKGGMRMGHSRGMYKDKGRDMGTYDSGEWEFGNQQISWFLIMPNFTKSDCARAETMLLFRTRRWFRIWRRISLHYRFLRIPCQHHKHSSTHPPFRHLLFPLLLYKSKRKRSKEQKDVPPLCLGALPPVLFLAVFLVFRLPSPILDRPPPRLGLVTVLAIFLPIVSRIYPYSSSSGCMS